MSHRHPEPIAGQPAPPSSILEIDAPGAGAPHHFPVTVQNLAGGVVTLEVKSPWSMADWENLRGRRGHLRLHPGGTEEALEVKGTLTWTKDSGDGRSRLWVGMELAQTDPITHKLLADQIPHTHKDIKGLWERWDQNLERPAEAQTHQKVYRAGLGLLLGGLACQLAGTPSYQFFGWILWFCGSLAVAGQILWSMRQIRLSP